MGTVGFTSLPTRLPVVLVAVSDTHGRAEHRLAGRTREAVAAADAVIHAGDFYTGDVLAAFESAADRLYGVVGNNDDATVRNRLPESRVVGYEGVTFAVRHRARSSTALSLFGREHDADAVVYGHSHDPGVETTDDLVLVNPGSHAQPRGNRQSHAEFEPRPGGGLDGRLVTVEGETFAEFTIEND